MKRTLKLATLFVFLLAAVYVCVTGAARSPAKSAQASESETRGRRIYFGGEDGSADEMVALLGGEELEVPATAFACASCHGDDGAGTREGGVQPPPITWEALTAPRRSALTNRQRAAYDATTLARAVTRGVDSGGFPLHAAMPRYRMSARQSADLVAFLKILGTERDADPGLNPQTIRIGAALPLTGALAAVGEAVRATLTAYFAELNARGGVYGRSFELVFEDSRGDAAGTLEATRKLVEERRVFALVASFEPTGDAGTGEYLRRKSVPLVGPLTLSPRPTVPPNPSVFYLLPTVRDQARALVEFVRAGREGTANRDGGGGASAAATKARLALVNVDDDFSREAAEGVASQARARGMPVALTRVYKAGEFRAAGVAEELARAKAEYVFFFGGAGDLGELSRALAQANVKVTLAGLALTLGSAALGLPPESAARLYLAHPTPLPNQEGFAEFIALLRRTGPEHRQPAFQAVAYGGAKTFVEAVKASGRRLSRASLVKSLEQLRDFQTGVLPPQSFDANRRVGATGAYVVGVDPANRQFTPLGGWLHLSAEQAAP